MMENRSFDHLLGWLKQDRNSSIDGLSGHQKVPRNITDHSYGYVQITRRGFDIDIDDPLHDFDSVALQIDRPQNPKTPNRSDSYKFCGNIVD